MPFDATPQHPRAAEIAIVDAMTERLQTHGWCRGKMEDGTRRCFVGALDEVVNGAMRRLATAPEERLLLWHAEDIVGPDIAAWNDTPGRTLPDVLNLLRQIRQRFEADA